MAPHNRRTRVGLGACEAELYRGLTVCRRCLQARALPARRLPYDSSQGPLPYQDLSPQHRQVGPHLPRRPQEYVQPLSMCADFS